MSSQTAPRQSAIGISVPQLGALLAPWRDPTVKVASKGVPPHITLLYPWRTPPLADSDIDALRSAIADIHTFSITFNTFGRFDSSILFLQPDDDGTLRRLMHALFAAFPDTPPYGGTIPDPTPHLTVAETSSQEQIIEFEDQARKALAPHLPFTIRVTQIFVLEQDEQEMWHQVAALPLLPAT
jgi:2'-5' RNA ligase